MGLLPTVHEVIHCPTYAKEYLIAEEAYKYKDRQNHDTRKYSSCSHFEYVWRVAKKYSNFAPTEKTYKTLNMSV